MSHPWKIWLTYFITLAMMIAVMIWLSVEVLEVDRRETIAKQQAELEEQVSEALWRMDSMLTPIIAREVARPYTVFNSFNKVKSNDDTIFQLASPLLKQDSEYILLHFEVRENNLLSSPQVPTSKLLPLAEKSGVSPIQVQQANKRLSKLRGMISHKQLAALLPKSNSGNLDTIPANDVFSSYPYSQSPAPNAPPTVSTKPQSNYLSRKDNFENNTLAQVKQQRVQELQQFDLVASDKIEVESICHPLWVGDQLLLARRTIVNKQSILQGAWLDWASLKKSLIAEVKDLLPKVDLLPLATDAVANPQRALAVLPVKLIVPQPDFITSIKTPIRTSLMIAWGCMVCVAVALAVLLFGVISLSERRGAFVSSVTHELRTPLTTFRIYTEMLQGGMVNDEAKQKEYLETLRVEADRLSHLVENVLSYAQLERGSKQVRRHKIDLKTLISRSESRLQARATSAQMHLEVAEKLVSSEIEVNTDPAAIEQILFNLVDNACKYAQSADDRRIHLDVELSDSTATIIVKDHGPGIATELSGKLFRPFSKTSQQAANSAAGVGLGLALCRRQARQLRGDLTLVSSDASGTTFAIRIPRDL